MADAPEESGERFYLGTIRKLFPSAGLGMVRSDSGREIPFAALHVLIGGSVRRFEELREGMRVGFDVGWTSRGLRVTVLDVRADDPRPPRREPTDEPDE
ncbi:MAG TPA: hypothetical protein VL049_29420 [Candidatus Dormibacteraeota bacterium]|nr:hypothetical protein [Candidatus Dormibacteraeota bacterium]